MKIWVNILLSLFGFYIGQATHVTNNTKNEKPKYLLSEVNLTGTIIDDSLPEAVSNAEANHSALNSELQINKTDSSNTSYESVIDKKAEPIDKLVTVENKSLEEFSEITIITQGIENSTIAAIIPEPIEESPQTTIIPVLVFLNESTETTIFPVSQYLKNDNSLESEVLNRIEVTLQDEIENNISSSQISLSENVVTKNTETSELVDLESGISTLLTATTIQPSTLNTSPFSTLSSITPSAPSPPFVPITLDPEVVFLRQKTQEQEKEKQVIIENMNKEIRSKNEIIDKMEEMHKKEIGAIVQSMNEIIKSKDETIGQMEETIRSKDETIKKTEESSKIQKEFETFKLDQCKATLSSLTAKNLDASPAECNFLVSDFEQSMQDLSTNIALKIEEVQNITGRGDHCICDDFSNATIVSSPTPIFTYINTSQSLFISEDGPLKIEDKSAVFLQNKGTFITELSETNLTHIWFWVDWCSWFQVELEQGSLRDCQFGMGSNEFYSGPGVEIQDCSVFLAVGGVMGSLLVVASIMMFILALRLRKVTKQQKRRKLEEVMRDHRRRYGLEPGGGGVYRGEP